VISYLGVGLAAPLISIVLDRRGVDSFVVGLLGTTMFGAFAVASYPIGAAIDRIGAKQILVAGLTIYGMGLLCLSLIEATWLFFLVRTVEGVGAAAITVATETMISKLSEPFERARRMAYYGLSVGVGWAMGPVTGALLFDLSVWLPFAAACALSILSAITVALFVPDIGADGHHHRGLLKGITSDIAIPLSAGALYGYLMSSLVTLFPLYLDKMGFGRVQGGSIVTAVVAGTMLCQVPIGRAADRFGKRTVLFGSAAILSLVFAAMPFNSRWFSFVALGPIVGAMAGSLYPVGLAMLAEVVSGERLGAATALFALAFGIGSFTGPGLSGFAMSHLGLEWLFYLPSIFTAAFSVELVLVYRNRKSSTNGESTT
jgi:MFS family permease